MAARCDAVGIRAVRGAARAGLGGAAGGGRREWRVVRACVWWGRGGGVV